MNKHTLAPSSNGKKKVQNNYRDAFKDEQGLCPYIFHLSVVKWLSHERYNLGMRRRDHPDPLSETA